MDKPDTITITVTDELWQHIVHLGRPTDLDDVERFVVEAVLSARGDDSDDSGSSWA
jgi:hypothetical protein